MKKITLIILTIGICGCLFNACDKIEEPYITTTDEQQVTVEFPELDQNSVYRKILIEEYTAHRCSNCPKGHAKLEELHNIFGDTLIAVGIHATALAAPNEEYPDDFRTETGNTLTAEYHIDGIPAGIINRGMEEGGVSLHRWESRIKDADRTPVAAIQMINEFNTPSENILKINTKVTMLADNMNHLRLSLFLVEDNIVSVQLNGDNKEDDYVHNHVLRAGINGNYGALLNDGTGVLEKGASCTYGYLLNFKDKNWNPDNCSVVAILFDKETHEVLQVEKAPVKNN